MDLHNEPHYGGNYEANEWHLVGKLLDLGEERSFGWLYKER